MNPRMTLVEHYLDFKVSREKLFPKPYLLMNAIIRIHWCRTYSSRIFDSTRLSDNCEKIHAFTFAIESRKVSAQRDRGMESSECVFVKSSLFFRIKGRDVLKESSLNSNIARRRTYVSHENLSTEVPLSRKILFFSPRSIRKLEAWTSHPILQEVGKLAKVEPWTSSWTSKPQCTVVPASH